MSEILTIAQWEIVILFGGLAAIILFKILSGAISLVGLLAGDRSDGTLCFSFGRAQLLAITTTIAVYYVVQVIQNPSLTSLPDIPPMLLCVLGGSQTIYLSGKA